MSDTRGRQYETAQLEYHGEPLHRLAASPVLELAEVFGPVIGKVADDIRAYHSRVEEAVRKALADHGIANPPYNATRHDVASAAEYCNVCENFPCLGGHPGPAEG